MSGCIERLLESWWEMFAGCYLVASAGLSGIVTSASNDVFRIPDRKLGDCERTERKGLLGVLRKLYI